MRRFLPICLFGLTALAPNIGDAYCISSVVSGTKAVWPDTSLPIPVHIQRAKGPIAGQETATGDAVWKAFEEWTLPALPGCTKLQFKEGTVIDAATQPSQGQPEPGIFVYWAKDSAEWAGKPESIGQPFFGYDNNGAMFRANLILNAVNMQWSVSGEQGKFDVQSVVAGELSYILGLFTMHHSTSSPLSTIFAQGDIAKRTMDIEAVAAVVGAYPGSTAGGACPPVTPEDTNCTAMPQYDGGPAPPDSGPPPQYDARRDAPADGGTDGGDNGGCGCHLGALGGGLAGGISLLMLALALIMRRSRS